MNDRKRAFGSSSEAASSTKKQALTFDVGLGSAISLHLKGGEEEAEKSGALEPRKLKVAELRNKLEGLGEPTSGRKQSRTRCVQVAQDSVGETS